jgi:hypothetical protein
VSEGNLNTPPQTGIERQLAVPTGSEQALRGRQAHSLPLPAAPLRLLPLAKC